ncbi:neurofilament medium polypeptide [Diachasma alloeum]|uniref:neurofilament medium polypeptide n=1 Tax=Diachasma alloeum TaxID=454923 RepID=UPI000738166C|nr:neurofilament medium polypeptide [Diachasma alloeum]
MSMMLEPHNFFCAIYRFDTKKHELCLSKDLYVDTGGGRLKQVGGGKTLKKLKQSNASCRLINDKGEAIARATILEFSQDQSMIDTYLKPTKRLRIPPRLSTGPIEGKIKLSAKESGDSTKEQKNRIHQEALRKGDERVHSKIAKFRSNVQDKRESSEFDENEASEEDEDKDKVDENDDKTDQPEETESEELDDREDDEEEEGEKKDAEREGKGEEESDEKEVKVSGRAKKRERKHRAHEVGKFVRAPQQSEDEDITDEYDDALKSPLPRSHETRHRRESKIKTSLRASVRNKLEKKEDKRTYPKRSPMARDVLEHYQKKLVKKTPSKSNDIDSSSSSEDEAPPKPRINGTTKLQKKKAVSSDSDTNNHSNSSEKNYSQGKSTAAAKHATRLTLNDSPASSSDE